MSKSFQFFSLLLLSLLVGARAMGEHKSEVPPPKYSLPFRNYCDLAMEGYCLGFSTVHAVTNLPPEEIRQMFSPEIVSLVEQSNQGVESATVELIRLFAILQSTKTFEAFDSKLPNLDSRSPKERRMLPPQYKMEAFKARFDKMMPAKKSGKGFFLNVSIFRQQGPDRFLDASLLGNHSLYVFDGALEKGVYRFYFLDPNRPREVQWMEVDPQNKKISFSTDIHEGETRIWSEPITSYSMEDAKNVYEKIFHSWQEGETPRSKTVLAFLHLKGGAPEDYLLLDSNHLAKDDDAYGVIETKVTAIAEDIQRFEKDPDYRHRMIKESYDSDDSFMGDMDAIISYAQQAQLDRNCGALKDLTHRFLSDALLKPTPVTKYVAKIGLRNVLRWVLQESLGKTPDGKRIGTLPAANEAQIKCLEEIVLPDLALSTPSLLDTRSAVWPELLDEFSAVWLVQISPESITDKNRKKITNKFIKRLPVDRTIQTVWDQAGRSRLTPRLIELMDDLDENQKEMFSEWEKEMKSDQKTDSDFQAHRIRYAWNALEFLQKTDAASMDPEIRKRVGKWARAWFDFIDLHDLDRPQTLTDQGVEGLFDAPHPFSKLKGELVKVLPELSK